MVTRVLVIGGYGNFGSYVARSLAGDDDIDLVIGGRSGEKASAFAAQLRGAANGVAIDINGELGEVLSDLEPDFVIHTVGPFQNQNYRVAEACIAQGCHYADLADAREFVAGIGALDEAARARGVLIIAGASSVPCLTAAIIDEALPRFGELTAIDYGISAAQQTNRGLATASAILSYVGKPFTTLCGGRERTVFGWQGLHSENYPELGRRLFGNCDIPDLSLFPWRYRTLRDIRFCAGHEIESLHVATWLLSWAVRMGVIKSLAPYAERLLKASFLFDPLGSSRSGFHMRMSGTGPDGRARRETMFIIARSGHGPYIPCMPVILLARRLARGGLGERGARACVDLIGLEEYLGALDGLDIEVIRDASRATTAPV